MSPRTSSVAVVVVTAAIACAAGFFAGARFPVPAAATQQAASALPPCIPAFNPRPAPARALATAAPHDVTRAHAATDTRDDAGPSRARDDANASGKTCEERLRATEQIVRADDELRIAQAGTPIPMSARAPAPRFQQAAMSSAVMSSFAEAKVPGRMDGIDCSEFPCIAFGRIAGTEDEMEKLEHARSLAPYDDDISAIFMWTVSDDEAREQDAHAEQELYAIAFYTRADRDALGDNLDRRMRARVGELWNTMSPSDETARTR